MEENKYFEALGQPFDSESVKWKIQCTNKEKTSGFAVPYADSRAIADRLDAVAGQMNWQDSYTPWHSTTETDDTGAAVITESQLCTISIYFKEREEWVHKTDGASDSDFHPVKGGLSDAFKRAASKWNIGRYLYKFEGKWVKIEKRGRSYVIADNETAGLAAYYNQTVARLFPGNSAPSAPVNNTRGSGETKATQTNQPKTPAASGAQNQPLYEVLNVEVANGGNGTSSKLKLKNGDKVITVFLNGENDRIQKGTNLKGLKLQERKSSFGSYHVIEQYDIAA